VLLSGLKHRQQRNDYDCLVVCCQMILSYLGVDKDERWLWRQLRSGQITPFSNVKNLATELGLAVEIGRGHDDIRILAPYLEMGLPVIVAVDTNYTDGWPYVKDHAVVVVGFTDEVVYVHDPATPEALLTIDSDTFLLAWVNRDYEYVVIRLLGE